MLLFWILFYFIFLPLGYLGVENAVSGRTTYVHCKAGRGRSTTIVICYLVGAQSEEGEIEQNKKW